MVATYQSRYYFLDELPNGTHTELKRRWISQGHRPVCSILGYEFTYLYAALAPISGQFIALLLPDMTAESFAIFLDYFEYQFQQAYGKRKILLILNQASAHQCWPKQKSSVVLQYLPTTSP